MIRQRSGPEDVPYPPQPFQRPPYLTLCNIDIEPHDNPKTKKNSPAASVATPMSFQTTALHMAPSPYADLFGTADAPYHASCGWARWLVVLATTSDHERSGDKCYHSHDVARRENPST